VLADHRPVHEQQRGLGLVAVGIGTGGRADLLEEFWMTEPERAVYYGGAGSGIQARAGDDAWPGRFDVDVAPRA
jgi:hypothetical protein